MGYWSATYDRCPPAPGGLELTWGDAPADILGEAVDRIYEVFERDLDRSPSGYELRAGLEYALPVTGDGLRDVDVGTLLEEGDAFETDLGRLMARLEGAGIATLAGDICCGGCATGELEDANESGTPYVYYHAQDIENGFEGTHLGYGIVDGEDPNKLRTLGEFIVMHARAIDVPVEWNGDLGTRILVHPQEPGTVPSQLMRRVMNTGGSDVSWDELPAQKRETAEAIFRLWEAEA